MVGVDPALFEQFAATWPVEGQVIDWARHDGTTGTSVVELVWMGIEPVITLVGDGYLFVTLGDTWATPWLPVDG